MESAELCCTAPTEARGQAETADRIGLDLVSQGRLEEAIAAFRKGAETDPDFPAIHLDLGAALRLVGKREESIAALTRALALQPGWPRALYNLGTVLLESGDTKGALAAFRETVAHQPDWGLAHGGLGTALLASGALDEAKTALKQALALSPDLHLAGHMLGRAHWGCGEPEAAVSVWQGLRRDSSGCQECHLALALALLTSGDYAEGWLEYEWRWQCQGRIPLLTGLTQPVWDGSPLDGETVVLWAEQGLGDILQFVRFAALLQARGATVALLSRPNLDRLLATCPGVTRVSSAVEDLADCDYQLPLASLPRLLGVDLAYLPATEVPYLRPPRTAAADPFGPRSRGALRVGVVWGVEPGHPSWAARSCPLPALGALEMPGVELYSLQFGSRAGELGQPGAPRMADLSGVLGDFANTAALVDRLDLVVTVDTSMAHLAGALGKPVWTLLPHDADWRWLRDREDSPWYPTMRLFRQTAPGSWEPVVAKVAEALRGFAARTSPAARQALANLQGPIIFLHEL